MTAAPTIHAGADCVLRVLSELDDLPPDSNGALAYGDEPNVLGVVLLEGGRVCWAAAHGLRRRLTDLLRERCAPELTLHEVELVVQRCKQYGRPVGEALVADGRITADALRAAVLQHTVESLATPASWQAAPRWVPHRARGYQSAFTFKPAELLTYAASAAAGRADLDAAQQRLSQLLVVPCAAAFDDGGTHLLACRLQQNGTPSLSALRAAGAWAAQSFTADGKRSDVLKYTPDGQGGSWLAWRDAGLTVVAHCRDREAFSQAVRELQGHGWTAAVHSDVLYVVPRAAVLISP